MKQFAIDLRYIFETRYRGYHRHLEVFHKKNERRFVGAVRLTGIDGIFIWFDFIQ